MTKDESLRAEWQYRYTERLGILCGTAEPTPEQKKIALDEANEAILKLTDDERAGKA